MSYVVELGEAGSASAAFELTLRNRAPTSGEPPYVIGPNRPTNAGNVGPIIRTLEAGESVALVNVYCGKDCVPGLATLDGEPIDVGSGTDLGMRYLQHYYSVPSGEQRTLSLVWDEPEAWEGNSSGGVYRMTFANQVTIRPARLNVQIVPPPHMRIVSASEPLEIEGGTATYNGRPGSRLDVEIEFGPPLAVRLWRNVMRFLTTPLFRI
jgi:hypothetical protein